MYKCDAVFVKGECEDHYGGKYDDCVAVALDSAGNDYADGETGSCDYQGHLFLFLFEWDQTIDVNHDGEILVVVPASSYILHTSSTGLVSLWKYDTPEAARSKFEAWQRSYEEWDSQDD